MKGKGKGGGKRGGKHGKPPPPAGPDPNIVLGEGAPPPLEWNETTTVMMRNLPNKYTQRMLLTEINEAGFIGTFDFLYLPIDPETNANRGYCFINFVSPSASWLFKMAYEGRAMSYFNSNKVVSVNPATLQGFEANHAHYSSARVNRGDPAARPLFLRQPDQAAMAGGWADPGAGAGGWRGGRRGQRGDGALDPAAMGEGAPSGDAYGGDPYGGDAYGGAGVYGAPQVPYPGGGTMAAAAVEDACGGAPLRKFCTQCGGPIQPAFAFCPNCGASLAGLFPGS